MNLLNINIRKTSLIALLSFGLAMTGCKNDFLEKVPMTVVSPETVFATTDNAYAAINGLHRRLYSQWFSSQAMGGISGNMISLDALGEDMVMTAQGNGWFIGDYRWLSHRAENNVILRNNYGFFYSFIGNANQIIVSIDGAEGPDADKNFLKAQALTYRAWAYFNLVQMFGKRYNAGGDNSSMGMSLVTEPNDKPVARSSVADTYALINSDLEEAISLFANAVERPHKSHLNVNVAKGVRARVALTQENFPLAAQMAREARQGYALMDNEMYMAGFSDLGNREWIWGIEHREDQPTYFYSFFAYLGNFSSTNTRGNPKAISSLLYDEISDTDVRKRLWDPTGAEVGFPIAANGVRFPYMNRKFLLDNPGNSNGDLAIMRSGEMYLIEAEALARQGGQDAAAADVLYEFAVNRDSEYTRSANTGQALVDEILIQRRVELWGEGFRYYDLKRLNLPLDRRGANHIGSLAVVFQVPAGDITWEFLIPRAELDYTLGVVKQNPL